MTEYELENLSHLPVPPPGTDAKRAALNVALDAFDAKQSDKLPRASKENVHHLRQTETTRTKRSFRMHLLSRQGMALAASLAALMIAAPMTFQYMKAPSYDGAPSIESTPIASVSGKLQTMTEGTDTPTDAKRDAANQTADKEIVARQKDVAMAPKKKADRLQPSVVAEAPAVPQSSTGSVSQSAPFPRPAGLGAYSVGSVGDGRMAMRDVIEPPPAVMQEQSRDTFDAKDINPIKQVASEPVSTFSIDVDTASYAFVRRALNSGQLPPKDAVRVEEMINYFPYTYPAPQSAETPFKATVNVFPSPWNANNKLVHIAIKGYELKSAERPRANLVLLMDVSGSMEPADRLPLIKNAFRLLVDQLKPDDTISIVTYASGSGIALEPTKVSEKNKILSAIDALGAGGSTAGAAGIADAYRLAEANFDKSAVNRIVLATDGDFNVGMTDRDELKSYVERKRQAGIFLSILGVGQGNHNDALMQALAQNGNGTAAYVDTLNEARKVLIDEASSTLFTIAKDVKIQVEWNPARVSEYRLIGYETRNLKREDFNNDRVDAGDIGSGHTVTAIYEVTPVGAPKLVDDLRYASKADTSDRSAAPPPKTEPSATSPNTDSELGFLKMRYKRPNEEASRLIEQPILNATSNSSVETTTADVRFSTAVAAFGQMLKGEPYTQGYAFDDVLTLAQGARGDDPFGYRAEFLNLVRLAKSARP